MKRLQVYYQQQDLKQPSIVTIKSIVTSVESSVTSTSRLDTIVSPNNDDVKIVDTSLLPKRNRERRKKKRKYVFAI